MPVGKFNVESNAMKLRKGYSNYGAVYGRPSFKPLIGDQPLTMKVWEMVIDDGGYDQGGAYWGLRRPGEKIFLAESLESVPLNEYCWPDKGAVEMTCDAKSFDEAWTKIKGQLPGAELCPVKWVGRCDKTLLMRLQREGYIGLTSHYPASAWGRNWPYVMPRRAEAGVEFAISSGGYKHTFRVHQLSDIGEGTFVLEEKVYYQQRQKRKYS
jgi:hypothetical protein